MPISIEALAAFLLLSHFSCEAATLRVPSDYPTIQDAIHAAARSGDTVLVSPGTYVEVLQLNKSLTLTSTKGATETAVVGDTNSPVLWISLRANESATISGFKFTRGLVGVITSNRVTFEDNIVAENGGGGVSINGDDVTVRHNMITSSGGHNEAGVMVSGERALIEDNLIEGNVSNGCGGGISLLTGSSAVVLRNRIDRNHAETGGGICSRSQGAVYVGDNLIYDNDATYSGGGIFITGADSKDKSDGQWINNTVSDNTAVIVSQVYVTKFNHRAVIANNVLSAADGSIALACDDDDASVPFFDNNDIFTTGSTAATGSCAAAALGGTNLSAPPDFQDGANGHPYHLAPDSPLVDAGSNEAARRLNRDFGKRPRIIDGGHGLVVDIGAMEYRPE